MLIAVVPVDCLSHSFFFFWFLNERWSDWGIINDMEIALMNFQFGLAHAREFSPFWFADIEPKSVEIQLEHKYWLWFECTSFMASKCTQSMIEMPQRHTTIGAWSPLESYANNRMNANCNFLLLLRLNGMNSYRSTMQYNQLNKWRYYNSSLSRSHDFRKWTKKQLR